MLNATLVDRAFASCAIEHASRADAASRGFAPQLDISTSHHSFESGLQFRPSDQTFKPIPSNQYLQTKHRIRAPKESTAHWATGAAVYRPLGWVVRTKHASRIRSEFVGNRAGARPSGFCARIRSDPDDLPLPPRLQRDLPSRRAVRIHRGVFRRVRVHRDLSARPDHPHHLVGVLGGDCARDLPRVAAL